MVALANASGSEGLPGKPSTSRPSRRALAKAGKNDVPGGIENRRCFPSLGLRALMRSTSLCKCGKCGLRLADGVRRADGQPVPGHWHTIKATRRNRLVEITVERGRDRLRAIEDAGMDDSRTGIDHRLAGDIARTTQMSLLVGDEIALAFITGFLIATRRHQ